MLAVLAEEMREIERQTIEEFGIPSMVLMEAAGKAVVTVIEELHLSCRSVLVLVGSGNNGGDGLVIARHLHELGYRVQVWLLTARESLQGDARQNLHILEKVLPLVQRKEILTREMLKQQLPDLHQAELVVDAIWGIGLRGRVKGLPKEVILLVNELRKRVIAVDLPSGLDADTGDLFDVCIQAEKTVTFTLPKLGLCLYPGAACVGTLQVVAIGIPRAVIEGMALRHSFLDRQDVLGILPQRAADAHKGSVGKVLIVAGSRGMLGAALLTAKAALKMGAGLVTLALPESLCMSASAQLVEVMIQALPETPEGCLELHAWHKIEDLIEAHDVLVLGPGLARSPETELLVLQILENTTLPIVIDADGLNFLAGNATFLLKKRKHLIFTPHLGEMARLAGMPIAEVEKNRLALVQEKSALWSCVLVLKGARTLIGDGHHLAINATGNAGMATAGSGDVLAGMIGGLLAQKLSTKEAAVAGVYLHGLAGDLAKEVTGEMGLMAGDLVAFLPQAVLSLLSFSA